jgi:hypothetical protein
MRHVWSEAEDDYIRDNYKRMTDTQLSIELSRITKTLISPQAVLERRQSLQLMKSVNGRPKTAPPKTKSGRKRGRPPKSR